MIRLKHLLSEISTDTMKRVLDKIKSKKFRYIGMGDNSRVYEIDGEDLVLKITTLIGARIIRLIASTASASTS